MLFVAIFLAILQLPYLTRALPHTRENPTSSRAPFSESIQGQAGPLPLPDPPLRVTPIPNTNPQRFHINLPPAARDPRVWAEAEERARESNRIRAIATEIYADLVTDGNRSEASHQLGFADEREIRALVLAGERDRPTIAERIHLDFQENYS